MGYCMRQCRTSFRIPADKKDAALKAVKAVLTGPPHVDEDGRQLHFAWVRADWLNETALDELLGAWRWTAYENVNGDIVELEFTGEKMGNESDLFAALAPFVDDGSFIQMEGEEGELWRWCFDNGKLHERYGRVVFED